MTDSFQKKTVFIAAVILILSLIPMLEVAVYSRPFADDFGYSAQTHQVWQSTHSVLALLEAVGDEVVETYNDWQGSFSAIALFALEPAVFSEKIYGLSTLILIAAFLAGTFALIRTLIPEDKKISFIVFAGVSVLSMQTLPHAMQGFYWWNGASYYTLFYSLMLIQWALILKREKVILPSILGFLIGGGNLVSGLLNLEVTVLVIAVMFFSYLKSKNSMKIEGVWKILIILLFSALGFVINVTAPGNALRAAQSTMRPALEAIEVSFENAYTYMNEWMSLPVILLMLFILPFLIHYAKGKESPISDIPYPVLALILFCLFASMFTPTQYSMSEVGPRRIQNIRYFAFIIFLMFLELEAALRFAPVLKNSKMNGKSAYTYFGLITAGFVIFIGMYTIPRQNRESITSIAAERSFLIGESKAYAQERDEQIEVLNSEDKVVTIKSLYNHPVPIYYSEFDITGDPDDYRDISMCDFYAKDQINLE